MKIKTRMLILFILGSALGGCVRTVRTAPPHLCSEHFRQGLAPASYVRPPDELEQPAVPTASSGGSHGHPPATHSGHGVPQPQAPEPAAPKMDPPNEGDPHAGHKGQAR